MRKYIIPSLKDQAQHSRLCPRCNTPSGLIHQKRKLTVVDIRIGSVLKLRLRCPTCRTT